ncbi:hypothetical protein VFPPC_05379 [Pochonia chlamydosporia 170]|uniref:Uncharacterized protein n=1 Tax=Pochonia chlamydosporia 170 TaxID=1380566 RepID=A0A179FEU2_METCM|nr:hypothetical protein VFPPC_05379 [Pochonia chlamydosporia 170]OAQ64032.1 hypothetical protein VFPPC_05379 [Pochonia chlamydosporia 170]
MDRIVGSDGRRRCQFASASNLRASPPNMAKNTCKLSLVMVVSRLIYIQRIFHFRFIPRRQRLPQLLPTFVLTCHVSMPLLKHSSQVLLIIHHGLACCLVHCRSKY